LQVPVRLDLAVVCSHCLRRKGAQGLNRDRVSSYLQMHLSPLRFSQLRRALYQTVAAASALCASSGAPRWSGEAAVGGPPLVDSALQAGQCWWQLLQSPSMTAASWGWVEAGQVGQQQGQKQPAEQWWRRRRLQDWKETRPVAFGSRRKRWLERSDAQWVELARPTERRLLLERDCTLHGCHLPFHIPAKLEPQRRDRYPSFAESGSACRQGILGPRPRRMAAYIQKTYFRI